MILSKWIENYDNGKFDALDFSKAVKAGWTDWNCEERRIPGKTRKCAKVLCRITDPDLLCEEVELCNENDSLDRIVLGGVTVDIPSTGYRVTYSGDTFEFADASSCAGFLNDVRHRACFRTG